MFPSINEQMDLIKTGVVELLPEDELVKKIEKSIKTNKPLRAKLGADPSRPDLHIGHAVVLHKLRQFQDLGHTAVLIIGDFTAMIGDPTGKSKTRPQLTIEETKINGQSYIEQATIILKDSNLEVVYNSDWLGKMTFNDVIHLTSKYTVAQLLERDDFSKRFKSNTPISVHELLYPLAQAMDSAVIDSDIELGGTDQKFNLLVGREIQKAYGKEPQCILTMPLLEGTDGIEKMSKSLNNYIALTDTPREMFGKMMSIPDNMITRYMRYASFYSDEIVEQTEKGLADGSVHPRNAKVEAAIKLVSLYHSEDAGKAALEEFERIFKNKDLPDEIDEMAIESDSNEIAIMELLVMSNLVPSKKEAKRMLDQGGVMLDQVKIDDAFAKIDISSKRLLKVGKRKFLYVIKK